MRVVASEIRQIMENCTATDPTIDAFIVAAEQFITNVFAGDTVMSTGQLKEVEKWFVAHMLASTISRTTSEEEIGDTRVKWTGYWSAGLKSTPYGQMVLTLDVTGKLAKTGKTAVSMKAITSFDE